MVKRNKIRVYLSLEKNWTKAASNHQRSIIGRITQKIRKCNQIYLKEQPWQIPSIESEINY